MKKLIIAFTIFILGSFQILRPAQALSQYIFAPIQLGLKTSALSIKDSFDFFSNLKNLRNDNIKLIQENNDLKAAVVELKKNQEENTLLKNQLNLKNKDSFDKEFVLANVLGNPADLTGGSIIIDKGTRHGIKTGANVIEGNYLIGIVKEVSTERSLVGLITSADVSATVTNIDAAQKSQILINNQNFPMRPEEQPIS